MVPGCTFDMIQAFVEVVEIFLVISIIKRRSSLFYHKRVVLFAHCKAQVKQLLVIVFEMDSKCDFVARTDW